MMAGSSRPYTQYPESTVWLDGPRLTPVVRGGLVFISNDFGRTWRGPFRHNLPAEDSKPFALQLSTGQRCLLWNYPKSRESYRQLLAIAVSRPGEQTLAAMWKLRDGHSDTLQAGPEWSYPCAVEHKGSLYVIYTSEKKHSVMTIIPLESLATN
jgi:predicted neuraminidase